ncbi:M48 family metallopeptidase [Sporosarcina siberiensis]|uniref:M48 family metallopeptidase n=1 Tax=Sporosarcina siberiensis TaxID=1365606 RepID=A0ABW4SEG3_9BACL
MKVEFENEMIEFNVKYGKGKKLTIHMDSYGFITLKAPNGTSQEVIKSAVVSKGRWILEKMNEIKASQVTTNVREYHDEGTFLYLGKEHLLHELIEIGEYDEETLKNNLKKFYFTNCKKIIEKRIKIYEERLKVKSKSIEIIESKRKWGSCNSQKNLTFNYRLAMAPIEVIDYVIIHELCHILHMNHDRSFWRRVGSVMPDYKEKEKYLERHGQSMSF